MYHGLTFETRISTTCGLCDKRIVSFALTACIQRGGRYGVSKAYHNVCAIEVMKTNIKDLEDMIKHAGQRRTPRVSI